MEFQQTKPSSLLLNKRKTRRSKYKKRKPSNNVNSVNNSEPYFTVIGSNCNSLLGKQNSLLSSIQMFQPMVYMLQESRLPRKGMIKIPSYQVFESHRIMNEGGGLFTAIHETLNPVFISGSEENEEIMVIQAEFGQEKCRFINAYGPQEYADKNNKI